MSTKPAFSFTSSNNGEYVASPFWVKPEAKTNNVKKITKIVWKWFKLAIFAFLMVMGLWGCFQSMWDSSVAANTTIGSGVEFGFGYGTTGDWRYDLGNFGNYQYHTFSANDWTMAYGPFYGLFVFPGAALVLNLMYGMKNVPWGLNALIAIFILLLIIRTLSIVVTLRSTLQNEKMSEVQGKIAEINAKYKDMKDMASRQKKQQETMEIYRKHKIKPFAAFEQMFITLPIFLIVYRVVTIVRPLKATTLFTIWNFAYTPTSEIFSHFTDGGWTYIFFLLIVIPIQFLSMKLPQIWAKKRNRSATAISDKGNKQMKKTKMMQNVFAIVMAAIVAFSATGVGVYWLLNALFAIAQSYIMHVIIIKNRAKGGKALERLKALGID